MSDVLDDDGKRIKRFKYQTYHEQLKDVHAPSVFARTSFEELTEDEPCLFRAALLHWSELNLSTAFVAFSRKALPLSQSLPLLVHSRKEVLGLCLQHIDDSDEEGLRALLDLLQKLLEDLRSTLRTEYEPIISKLYKLFARRLSPESLSTLLSTLATVFRHLLFSEASQPPEDSVIENTWSLLCENVAKCDSETKRAAAEVWSPVLRRLKKDDQARCVMYMLTFSTSEADIVAWALVASAKSVAQTLHTCASPITSACLDFLLETDDLRAEAAITPTRRFLTALVHHCAKPAQFSMVTETITSKLTSKSYLSGENMRRLLRTVFVPCSVRQGSRISANELSQILDSIMKIPYDPSLLEPLSAVVTSCLCASTADLAVWMGAGRRAVEQAWEKDALFAVTLTGLLAESDWKAHKQFALPIFLEKGLGCLEGQDLNRLELSLHLQVLRSLAEIGSRGTLKDMDNAWRSRLAAWIQAWLTNFKLCDLSVLMLHEIIRLVPHITEKEIQTRFTEKAKELLEEEENVELQREADIAERAWVFGQMLRAAFSKTTSTDLGRNDIVDMLFKGVVKWSWSECALSGLLNAVQSSQINHFEHPLRENAMAKLLDNLKSHSQSLRQCSLEILSALTTNIDDVASKEALKRCLAAEKIPLNVEGARERVLRTSRIGQDLKGNGIMSTRILTSWLLGQLKVNLRPIWAPAIQALKYLSDTHEEVLWGMLISELRMLVDGSDNSMVHSHSHKQSALDEVVESERSWRDPSSYKLRVLIRKWVTKDLIRDSIIEEQSSRDRFDSLSYETQILGCLTVASSMTEKNNRDLIPLFLRFAHSSASSQKASRARLSNWLKLFSNLSNPRAFYQSDAYHALIIDYLSHPDRSLQKLSLECVLQYRTPVLTRFSDTLRHFLDDANFRNELALLDLQALGASDKVELVPVVIRLFYGLMLERGGRGRGFDRRSALLSALSVCEQDDLHLLVNLMLETFFERVLMGHGPKEDLWEGRTAVTVPEKQQIGFLTFLGDVLKHLANWISPKDLSRLLTLCVDLTSRAQASLQTDIELDGQDEVLDDIAESNEAEAEASSGTPTRQLRTIRQLGLKRIIDCFKLLPFFDFNPYMTRLYQTVISPRIPLFNQENVQAPSVLLQLFDLWAKRPDTAMYLVQYDSRTLPKIYESLLTKNVKPSVISCIIDLAERLLSFAQEDNTLKESLVSPFVPNLLSILTQRATTHASKPDATSLFPKEIALLSRLSPFVSEEDDAASLVMLLLPYLRQARNVSDQTRMDLLSIVSNIISVVPKNDKVLSEIFAVLSRLLQVCRGRQVRSDVLNSLVVYSEIDTSISRVAALLVSLNAYSTTRIENPDFETRLAAFTSLNTDLWKTLSEKEWPPVVHNMLFFIQDENELSIRTNASLSIRLFIDTVASSESDGLRSCFSKILLPGLKRCLKLKSEPVRNEVANLIAYVVQNSDSLHVLKDLQILLADGDEEANFFNNIYHIQIHRRTRALRRLAEFCDEPGFRSSTLQDVIVPILRGFIGGAGSSDHHLVTEAITTLGRVAKHLTWPTYHALTKYYLRMITDKSQGGRTYTRALVAILEGFHFSVEDKHEGNTESETDDTDDEGEQQKEGNRGLSLEVKIRDAVIERLLPSLLRCLDQKDEIEDERRIPIAIGIACVVLHLPDGLREEQVSKLLLVVSPMFRSKAQSTRDLARETLYRIAIILGPIHLPSIIRHLREALLRGPHLHILAFVVHSLLVHVTSLEHSSDFTRLDTCIADAVHVSTEVIFGQSGKDLQSDTFKSTMKEVKSSSGKGMDTFAILAKYISPATSRELLLPLKAIMQETESAKTMHTVEELLRKMSSSLVSNANFSPSDILVFCHTLISQNAQFFQQSMKLIKQKGRRKGVNDAIVQLKRKVESEHDHYAHNSWRFISFGLDLFVSAFKRGRFDFHDEDVMSRLKPLVNVIGNSLYASNGNVVSSGIKAIAQLVKCPLKNVEDSIPIFVRQALQIIRSSGNTESDLSQTTLKVLATMIRDCQGAQVKEKDLVYLLELLGPDLEEPERQGTAFTVLRAILSRKFIVPEIYDLMGRVEQIMVTSQSASVQEQCRAALLQFLLDYPQGKTRLQRQFAFFAKNLSYEFESGRLSVMEFLTAAVAKFNDDIIATYAEMLFVALVLVIANDDSGKCRERAAQVIKALVLRLQEAQLKVIMSLIHSWASSNDNAMLSRVSSQMYGLMLDTLKADTRSYLPVLLTDLRVKIDSVITGMNDELDDEREEDNSTSDWQVPYQTVIAYSKAFAAFPELISSSTSESSFPWQHISVFLLYPHKWVRTATCRLLGTFFAASPITAPLSVENLTDVEGGVAGTQEESTPFSVSWTRQVANALALQLKSENLDEPLGTQIVKNLFFVGKCLSVAVLEAGHGDEPTAVPGDEGKEIIDGIEEDSGEEDDVDEKSVENEDKSTQNLLPWLFSKLSFQARAAHIARQNRKTKADGWFHQLSAIFKWFAAMISYLPPSHLSKYLPHILSPVYRVSEDDITRDAHMETLKILTAELTTLLQARVGVPAFAAAYSTIRQRIATTRLERKTKRAVQTAVNPIAAAKRKKARHESKKEGKRRKMNEFAERKVRTRHAKRRNVD